MHRVMRIAPLLATAWMMGCAGAAPPPDDATDTGPPDRPTPEEALSALEEQLLSARAREVAFQVTAEGAFEASIQGRLELPDGDELTLEALGTFGADSVALQLEARGDRMVWSNSGASAEDAVPPALKEGVVIGWVRMGVLHNLARLIAGSPPDRTDGGVRRWVRVEELAWVEGVEVQEGERGIAFRILVQDQPVGRATLRLNSEGMPVGREQVVEFPGGQMRVSERYRWRE